MSHEAPQERLAAYNALVDELQPYVTVSEQRFTGALLTLSLGLLAILVEYMWWPGSHWGYTLGALFAVSGVVVFSGSIQEALDYRANFDQVLRGLAQAHQDYL